MDGEHWPGAILQAAGMSVLAVYLIRPGTTLRRVLSSVGADHQDGRRTDDIHIRNCGLWAVSGLPVYQDLREHIGHF